MISLVAEVHRGFRRNANVFSIETAISALYNLAALSKDDKCVDKWLYQAIGLAVETKVGRLDALALADSLEARLKRRIDADSFEVAALRAGASVNAARLQLEDVIAVPSAASGAALALRGARGAMAITVLVQAISRDQRSICSISPQNYAESLRATLSRGASTLEARSPELAALAWRCRHAAVEALIVAAPDDVNTAASEAIRGLAIHSRIAPLATAMRVHLFASLEERLEPWRAVPSVIFEWFLRHAEALEAVGENEAAATARFTGRLHLCQQWPLFNGILLCGDLQIKQYPSITLSKTAKCFNMALDDNNPSGRYRTMVWRRAWTSISRASVLLKHCSDRGKHGDSPAEAALLVLAEVVGRCEEYLCIEMRESNAHQAEAYWRAATLAAERGSIYAAIERCNIAEGFSSTSSRVALGLIKTGLAALSKAENSDELHSTAALLERATGFPYSWSVAWTALAGCLRRLGLPLEAALAAAEATCHPLNAGSVRNAVVYYSYVSVYIQKQSPTLLLAALHRANVRFAEEVLTERLLVCEMAGSNLELIIASQELAACDVVNSKPALSHTSIQLVRRGAFHAGLMLAQHGIEVAHCYPTETPTAWCILALAATFCHCGNDTFQALALLAVLAVQRPKQTLLDAESIISATVALKDLFFENVNLICESSACDFFWIFSPQLWPAVVASSMATVTRGGFVLLAQTARTDFHGPVTAAKKCHGTSLSENRHFKILLCGTLGGGNSESFLTLAFDEARASLRPRAIADIGLQMFDRCMRHGDTLGACNTSRALKGMLRLPRHHKRGVLFNDTAHSQMIKINSLWLYLAHLWLVCGYNSRSIKYSQRAVSSKHDKAASCWAVAALELSTSIAARDWRNAATVLEELDYYAESNFPSRVRCVEQVLIKGDLLRRQGNFQDAGLCYITAKRVLIAIQNSSAGLTVGRFIAAKLIRCGTQALFSRQHHQVLGRVARLMDLQGSQICAEAAYRIALRSQPSNVLDNAWVRYRLGRILLKRAFITTAASTDALDHLRCAFLTAWRAHHWKLATKSARALTVAALHFVPGAMSSPTVALLAHVSLGQARLTLAARDCPTGSLSLGVAQVDSILDSMLHVGNAQGAGWYETIGFHTFDTNTSKNNAMVALDTLLSPLPETYCVVATLIAPTGHLVMARIQRGRAPLTLCAPLPRGWHDISSTSDSAVSLCCNALRASACGLHMDVHSVEDKRFFFSRATRTKHLTINGIDDSTTMRAGWWSQRHSIDSALEAGLDYFDQTWLGAMRALLATEPASRRIHAAFSTSANDITEILSLCMNAAPYLSRAEASALLCAASKGVIGHSSHHPSTPHSLSNQIVKAVHSWLMTVALLNVVDLKAALADLGFNTAGLKKQLANRLSEALQRASSAAEHNVRVNIVPAARKPLILALDERLHCLPIEDLAVPREAPVSRVPSLAFALSLATQMRFREWDVTDNLLSMRTCCVVDPDANLPATRHRIQTYLDFEHSCPSKLQLSCASPSTDNKETMKTTNQIVTDMPGCTAYLFCGHGHGSVYLEDALENELSSAVLLMGCSSGSLSSEGDFEPRGVPVELLARGIPSVVGMLWDVTDGDMDRFTLRLLHLLANNPSGLIPDLLRDAKNVTKLRKLNGAAPVCYGLPVSLAGLERARQVSHPRVTA